MSVLDNGCFTVKIGKGKATEFMGKSVKNPKETEEKVKGGQYPDFIYTENDFYVDASTLDIGLRDEALNLWNKDRKFDTLYYLGLDSDKKEMNESIVFLVRIAEAFFECLTQLSELELIREKVIVKIDELHLQRLLDTAPFVIGSEYISKEWIQGIFDRLTSVFAKEIINYNGKVEAYLAQKSERLHTAERIFFHLVENKNSDFPFAFIATYSTKKGNKVKHMPLGYALTEFKNHRNKLMELLSCLNKVAEVSTLISSFMETGELFHPLKITSQEAYEFLKQIGDIEALGVLCRIPNWWRKRSMSITKTIKLGEKEPSSLSFDTLITLTPTLTVNGEELTKTDIKKILSQSDGLAFLKGKWIEVNHKRLEALLSELEQGEKEITLLQAFQMNADTKTDEIDIGETVSNGKWLYSLFQKLKNPETIKNTRLPKSVKAKLRPYQLHGYTWLNYMNELNFGACLADDMGLGKTLQVLSYLEKIRIKAKNSKILLIVPASLLGNWEREIQKFVLLMDYQILHGNTAKELGKQLIDKTVFLNITTYGMASRIKELEKETWDVIILDEAQAIKNPASKQTKQIKSLDSKMRIAMTGTPIENDLTNLWSLFDFLNKGLLGTSSEFKRFSKTLKESPVKYIQLKNMISPFLLRRLKVDKQIISDLPDKFEMIDYAGLSKKQIVLYRKIVSDMKEKIIQSSGINRRGLILSTIMKLKQVCNHPSQYLGETDFLEEDSGKFQMLKDLCEVIYEKRERVLVFTQFKEITEILSRFLSSVFHSEGLVLHGSTSIKERNKIVEVFQSDTYIPFIVLSVKAGGTGLNLTNANHVIHFDRWWNPAVENQATDRAFRIGQDKNVMVHKLVCRETIEEKIDEIIESKQALAKDLIDSAENKWITELSDDEILKLLSLGR